MRTHPLLQLCLLVILALLKGESTFGQNTGEKAQRVIEERVTGGFHSLCVSGLAEVYLTKGTSMKAKVEVSGMPSSDVVITLVDSVLKVTTRGSHNNETVKVYVDYRSLKAIEVSGAAKLFGQGPIKAEDLSIFVYEAGSATLKVNVGNVTIALRKGGDLKITGTANQKQIRSAGDQGTLDDSGLKVR